jgi:hypothetical protein
VATSAGKKAVCSLRLIEHVHDGGTRRYYPRIRPVLKQPAVRAKYTTILLKFVILSFKIRGSRERPCSLVSDSVSKEPAAAVRI